ncbi:MAG: hypothetical protein Tsb009_09800 [Planctomycetaceae bacterium]
MTDGEAADDAALVRRCLNGDGDGLRAFVARFQGLVFRLCYRMLGHREDAEDITQEVFVRIFKNLHRWDSSRPLKPWLITITANRCRTALTRRARLPVPSEFVEEQPSSGSSAPDDLGEELQLGLDQLREEYRTCFVLFHQQEMSCLEISEILDRPEGTIKTWLHRARRELADFLIKRGIAPHVQTELQQA